MQNIGDHVNVDVNCLFIEIVYLNEEIGDFEDVDGHLEIGILQAQFLCESEVEIKDLFVENHIKLCDGDKSVTFLFEQRGERL